MLKPRTSLRQKRVTFTLFFVCSIFIAVTLPFTLVEILSYAPPIFNAKPIVVYELKLVTYLVYCINFVVNPFIYFFGNTFYRKELFELINNSFFCGKCKLLLPQNSVAWISNVNCRHLRIFGKCFQFNQFFLEFSQYSKNRNIATWNACGIFESGA